MKAIQFFRAMIILTGLLLSACAGSPASQTVPAAGSVGSDKSISEVVFTGVVEQMNGDQWVIDGQTVQVDSSALRNGPFVIGDSVKVEAQVAEDGTVTAQRVESPSAADLAVAATSTPEVVSAATPIVFDNNGTEAVGAVEAMTETSITVGGQSYSFAPGAEIKGAIEVGTVVKLHFLTNADGTLAVREVEIADPTQISNGNSNDDNSNDAGVNNNSSNDNSNDDSANANNNESNANDDNGNGNSNDDDDNDSNSNDDNSNDSNDNG